MFRVGCKFVGFWLKGIGGLELGRFGDYKG